MQRPRESFHADSDAPSTSKKLHICESTGMHNKHFVYTHTLSHKLTQCAQTDMLDKPAHSDCSHVVHNRALLTHYRCTYQNTMSTQECIVLSNWITMHPSSPSDRKVIQHSRYMLQIALQGTPLCQCDTHTHTHTLPVRPSCIISISRQRLKLVA